MAIQHPTAATAVKSAPGLRYDRLHWGEVLRGTKAQIQALGIASDRGFPGEPGAPKRAMTVFDPRGLRAQITRELDGSFGVSITYPDVPPKPEPIAVSYAPGVTLRREAHGDVYTGTREALIAANVVPAGCFPGDPGMRKVRVTINPDGSLPQGGVTGYNRLAYEPGARCIERAGGGMFECLVKVTRGESDQRRAIEQEIWEAHVALATRIPKPRPLAVRTQADVAKIDAMRSDSRFARFMQGLSAAQPGATGQSGA